MTYDPSVSLTGEKIENLLRFVWQQTKKYRVKIDAKRINKSAPFKAVLADYPCLNELL